MLLVRARLELAASAKSCIESCLLSGMIRLGNKGGLTRGIGTGGLTRGKGGLLGLSSSSLSPSFCFPRAVALSGMFSGKGMVRCDLKASLGDIVWISASKRWTATTCGVLRAEACHSYFLPPFKCGQGQVNENIQLAGDRVPSTVKDIRQMVEVRWNLRAPNAEACIAQMVLFDQF